MCDPLSRAIKLLMESFEQNLLQQRIKCLDEQRTALENARPDDALKIAIEYRDRLIEQVARGRQISEAEQNRLGSQESGLTKAEQDAICAAVGETMALLEAELEQAELAVISAQEGLPSPLL
jgi:hypothetical protein